MRILVTGGHGLVGKALQQVTRDDSENTWIFLGRRDVNILDIQCVHDAFQQHKPDIVVHLAARCGGLYMNMEHNEAVFVDNTIMNMNVVSAAEKCGVKKCIAMLSTCVFPDPPPALPLTEHMIHSGPPAATHEGYAISKRTLELHCRLSAMQTICLIPTNIYGPWDNFQIDCAHVIPALIHKCYLAKQSGEKFVVSGSGKALRQFIYSEDLAKIIVWAVRKQFSSSHQSYICAPPETDEYDIKTIAEYIAEYFHYSEHLVYDMSYVDGQLQKTASNAALMKEMDASQITFVEFKKSLHATIKWFVENYEASRH